MALKLWIHCLEVFSTIHRGFLSLALSGACSPGIYFYPITYINQSPAQTHKFCLSANHQLRVCHGWAKVRVLFKHWLTQTRNTHTWENPGDINYIIISWHFHVIPFGVYNLHSLYYQKGHDDPRQKDCVCLTPQSLSYESLTASQGNDA